MTPRPLLQLEGAAVLMVSVLLYRWSHGSWLQFALLFLVPDLSMIGYLANPRAGAITYNAVHSLVGPLALAAYSFGANRPAILALSIIWIAHIGFDRMLEIRVEVSDSVPRHASEPGPPRSGDREPVLTAANPTRSHLPLGAASKGRAFCQRMIACKRPSLYT
jgi:hypothetical protein